VTTSGGPQGRTASSTGWYVYGVVPLGEARETVFDGLEGVGGGSGSVSLVDAGQLAAIVSEVPLSEFGQEPIVDNLRDPSWLEHRARAHEAVLDTALRFTPVVPFRFGTIYSGEDHVREMLSAHERLTEALERVRGRVELGVKGFLAETPADTAPNASDDESSAGRRYLEEKQRARQLAEERDALKARLADASHERLAAGADGARANPLQPREVSRSDHDMFLNGAYLVATDREAEFRAALEKLEAELGPRGAVYELTGPWPPYNFVEEPA
jgi:hypothetical protein